MFSFFRKKPLSDFEKLLKDYPFVLTLEDPVAAIHVIDSPISALYDFKGYDKFLLFKSEHDMNVVKFYI